MIAYIADRAMNILATASTSLDTPVIILEDTLTDDLETGVASFKATLARQGSFPMLMQIAACGNYLLMKDTVGSDRVFTIMETESNMVREELTLYAEDAGLDLINEIAAPYAATEPHTIAYYINRYIGDSGFVIGRNELPEPKLLLSWDAESTRSARIADIAAAFGAEIGYRFNVDGLRLTEKIIDIFSTRGRDPGAVLRIGVDASAFTISESIGKLATALLPTGDTPEGSDAPVDLVGYSYDDGDIYLEDGYLKSRSALERWSRYRNPTEPGTNYTGHILRTFYAPVVTQTALCDAAVKELRTVSQPETTYEASIDGQPQDIQLGDRVTLVTPDGEQAVSARVQRIESSASTKTHKITLGDYAVRTGQTDDFFDRIAELAGAINSAVQAAQSAADSSAQTANSALDQASKAQTKAAAAEQAAGAAQTAADAAQTAAEEAKTDANNKAPISHASNATTYGKSTSSLYGHVKLSDSVSSTLSAASGGTAATPAAVKAVHDLIGGAKIITGSATIDYGTQTKYADVTFGYTFQNPPFVIAMQVFNGIPLACMIGSVTKTGARFSLQGDFTSSGSREFRWLAIGV